MILDERNKFCNGTALNTGEAGSYSIGNVIDLGAVHRDIGNGEQLYLVIQVDTTATSGGAATGQFSLVSDAQDDISTNGSASVHFQTDAIPVAKLVAGYNVASVALPMEGKAYERYLGILQTTGTAAFTAGKVDAFLTHDVSKIRAYADAL